LFALALPTLICPSSTTKLEEKMAPSFLYRATERDGGGDLQRQRLQSQTGQALPSSTSRETPRTNLTSLLHATAADFSASQVVVNPIEPSYTDLVSNNGMRNITDLILLKDMISNISRN
jgi:anionic cell wall polymer biosynthesis LytR-Cps2A-Psr (LCP) family protein